MRIEQLQAFLAVADTGNFGQAARQCGVTQSTISRQIQSLETDLGLPLFHRTAQAKLTIAGEKLLPRAKRICQEWANVHEEITDLQAGKQPELCVAAIHSVCAHYLPPILPKFCAEYPEVQLRVTALGSDRALKVLRDGLVDVALVMNPIQRSAMVRINPLSASGFQRWLRNAKISTRMVFPSGCPPENCHGIKHPRCFSRCGASG